MENAPSNVQMLDTVTIEQLFTAQSRRRSEKVAYYRRPKDWSQPRWIVIGQTQPQIRFPMQGQGFEPLPQYGTTPPNRADAARFGCVAEDSSELWTPILMHPTGPNEFPAEQVKAFRWYRPEGLPGIMKGRRVRFPQFEEMAIRTGGIKEYKCPDCTNRTWFLPGHLARHLHNSHGYDQAAIIALGTAAGINFNEGLMSLVEAVQTWDVPESDVEQEMSHTPPQDGIVVVKELILPNRQQVEQARAQVAEMNEDDPAVRDLKQQIEDLKAMILAQSQASTSTAPARKKKPLSQAQINRNRAAVEAKRAKIEAEKAADAAMQHVSREPVGEPVLA